MTDMPKSIYLDNNSTTPIDPRVVALMEPFLREHFGNPHSEHSFGWAAADAVDRARSEVAELLGADKGEVIFTSGATEANNMAIQGIARSEKRRGNHFVTTAIEHKCVLNTMLSLKRWGMEVDVIPVSRDGIVAPEDVFYALRDDTALVSVMAANNEIGTLQPLSEIAESCNERGIPFHVDAAQGIGKVSIDVGDLGIDLLSISGHKIYGPKGIGALFVSRDISSKIEPLIMGGGQQDGLRAGTLPTFLCVGLGAACKIAGDEMLDEGTRLVQVREAFENVLRQYAPNMVLNGDVERRLHGNLNLQFPGVDADSLLTTLNGVVAASTGSACNSGIIAPSYVLMALGLGIDEVNSSVRIGFGRFTTIEEAIDAAHLIGNRIDLMTRKKAAG